MEGEFLFHLLTPLKEVASCRCEAVNLVGKEGAQAMGGSIGIRHGHLPAVVALAEGSEVRVTSQDKTVFSAKVRGGFARVDRDSVTVLTPDAEVTMDI